MNTQTALDKQCDKYAYAAACHCVSIQRWRNDPQAVLLEDDFLFVSALANRIIAEREREAAQALVAQTFCSDGRTVTYNVNGNTGGWPLMVTATAANGLIADRDRLRAALESAVLKIEDIFAQEDCAGSYCDTFRRGHGEHREFCERARAALAL